MVEVEGVFSEEGGRMEGVGVGVERGGVLLWSEGWCGGVAGH